MNYARPEVTLNCGATCVIQGSTNKGGSQPDANGQDDFATTNAYEADE